MLYAPSDIVALRERLQFSQRDLADELGVAPSNVSRWESGLTRPRGSAIKLLDALARRAKRKSRSLPVEPMRVAS